VAPVEELREPMLCVVRLSSLGQIWCKNSGNLLVLAIIN
jgi:hypothetical protein